MATRSRYVAYMDLIDRKSKQSGCVAKTGTRSVKASVLGKMKHIQKDTRKK